MLKSFLKIGLCSLDPRSISLYLLSGEFWILMNGVVGRILGQILIVFLPFPGHKWPLFRRRSSTCCNIAFNTTWVLRIFFLSGFPYTNSNSSRYSLFELNLTSQDLTTLNAECWVPVFAEAETLWRTGGAPSVSFFNATFIKNSTKPLRPPLVWITNVLILLNENSSLVTSKAVDLY